MKKPLPLLVIVTLVIGTLMGCGQQQDKEAPTKYTDNIESQPIKPPQLASIDIQNRSPYLPPQCYTKTKDEAGNVHNPCYVCHTASKRPNFMNDMELQLNYNFQDYLLENQWSNLFVDRSKAVAAISDQAILDYVRHNNYQNPQGRIVLADKLKQVPKEWDGNSNGQWDGYIPDLYLNFDSEGFDHNPDGSINGWRAFAYAPVPSTFWPTNGSMDDVLIRLPELYRQNSAGEPDLQVYRINLAVVESLIKEQDIAIPEVDETIYRVDLDRNGGFNKTTKVVYRWAPLQKIYMSYVGAANEAFAQGKIKMAAGLFPLGTEFLHSLRYLDLSSDGEVVMAPRMKELRYARKVVWNTYGEHEQFAASEAKERHDFPDRARQLIGDIELGMRNGSGWNYQGFIEDSKGELRPQSFEELGSCVACHSTIGTITDSTFAFRRKLDGTSFQAGWYHWSQKGLGHVKEPIREDGEPEYAFYLRHNGAGNEYRSNDEVRERFFDDQGHLKPEMLEALREDISLLLIPSSERALLLNKTYRTIVKEQSYIKGRDVVIGGQENIHRSVESGQSTEIQEVLNAF